MRCVWNERARCILRSIIIIIIIHCAAFTRHFNRIRVYSITWNRSRILSVLMRWRWRTVYMRAFRAKSIESTIGKTSVHRTYAPNGVAVRTFVVAQARWPTLRNNGTSAIHVEWFRVCFFSAQVKLTKLKIKRHKRHNHPKINHSKFWHFNLTK